MTYSWRFDTMRPSQKDREPNELPRSKLRGIKGLNEPIEERELASMYLMIRSALLLHILLDYPFIAVLSYGVRVVATCPEPSSPEHLLDFGMTAEDLPGGDTLNDLHDRLR